MSVPRHDGLLVDMVNESIEEDYNITYIFLQQLKNVMSCYKMSACQLAGCYTNNILKIMCV